MKIVQIVPHVLVTTLLFTHPVWANPIQVVGSKEATVQPDKVIHLLKVRLSYNEKQQLAYRSHDVNDQRNEFAPQLAYLQNFSSKVDIGMNKVPVLDQGRHGSCVTFALTAALDAVVGKGDYISQLCNLELGSYFENKENGISGWEGSYATYVINQITNYGVVNMKSQHAKGCGGMKDYPKNKTVDLKAFITPEDFTAMSEPIFDKVATWSDVLDENNATATLNNVKAALNSGNRVVFAVLLPRVDLGIAGAVGKYKTWLSEDSWVLTSEILKGVDKVEAAHEMVIIGYDDKAQATDNKGKKHKGLLKIRNSWGTEVGDKGQFYMSYDYFKLLAYDAQQFVKN